MFKRLPNEWTKRILAKLHLTYGERFARLYANVQPQMLEDDWSETLGGFCDNAEAIKYGLANLPIDAAPTALQFREICRQYKPVRPALPAPAMSREARAEMAQKVRDLAEAMDHTKPGYDFLRWARNPRSWAAASAVAELISKRDPRFVEIGRDLVAQGHAFAEPIKAALDKRAEAQAAIANREAA
ncbi:hypothetical protein IP84_16925 [beta proteobacterium AAP99]|nr:hypothetical protein IP84_16925 [beta proteobacterium AAP99]